MYVWRQKKIYKNIQIQTNKKDMTKIKTDTLIHSQCSAASFFFEGARGPATLDFRGGDWPHHIFERCQINCEFAQSKKIVFQFFFVFLEI